MLDSRIPPLWPRLASYYPLLAAPVASLPSHARRRVSQVAWAVVAVGCLLRVVVWLQARSVYLDEVSLLRNFVERGYAGLFRPLGYEQYAPPLFAGLMKGVMQLLGTGELAIRLVPMLAGCGLLVLLRHLALRWLAPAWALLALATVAFSSLYLDFATVCKQYSTDSLVAVALLVLAERQVRRATFTGRAAVAWAAAGAALVWASMPAVFVLAGVGLALAWAYRAQLRGPVGGRLVLVGVSWALSFGGYFKLLLQADAQSDYLQSFHHDAFLAFPPRSAAELALLGSQVQGLVDKGFGKTVVAMLVAALGLLAGTGQLLRRPSARTWLLLVPLGACLAASALRYYSLLPRLMLFVLPLALLLLGTGLQALAARGRAVGALLLLGGLATLGSQQRLKFFAVPFQADYADVRAGLRYVAAHQQAGETAFIYHNEAQVAYYYRRLSPQPLALRDALVERYRPTPHDDLVQQDLLALAAAGHRAVWLVYDRPDSWLRDWAAQHGTVTQDTTFFRGYAFRVVLAPVASPARPAPAPW